MLDSSTPDTFHLKPHQQGVALITVLLVSTVVIGLLVLVSSLVVRDSQISRNDASATQLTLLADGTSDVARVILVNSYFKSNFSLAAWLNNLAPCRNIATCVPLSGNNGSEVKMLAGTHLRTQDGIKLTWKVLEVSPAGPYGWVRLAATATSPDGAQQTVLRRVEFGTTNIFNLAMLSDTTNCMFCHLKINGDVGATGFLRPGWGTEGHDGKDSARQSKIVGDVYAALNVTAEGSNGTLNGVDVTGKINKNYTGNKLPKDTTGDGVPDFPGLDSLLAKKSATGSLKGGTIRQIPLGGQLTNATTITSGNRVIEGNLILEGTAENPIVLEEDVYVTGDVVIKGVITGRGALYTGRNLYVAGNLVNKNKSDKPGKGVCSGVSDPDQCAKKNISAGKDETRLAATNNIILGDYTQNDASGEKLSIDRLQGNDFVREQFGLGVGSGKRYVRKGTSEEVRLQDGSYIDGVGRKVAAADVVVYGGAGKDPFTALITPGNTGANGNFTPWLTDAQYANLLGTETLDHNTWRSKFPTSMNEKAIADALIDADLPSCQCSKNPANGTAEAVAKLIAQGKGGTFNYTGKNLAGQNVNGVVNIDGRSVRVGVNTNRTIATETTALDAFLYANSRIGGRISARGGYINGGLIAREIGVLAPGRNDGEQWWRGTVSAADRDRYNKCDVNKAGDTTVDAAIDTGAKSCDYAINYDHRLRNGGYGFNLIQGITGGSSEWQLDLNGDKAVNHEP